MLSSSQKRFLSLMPPNMTSLENSLGVNKLCTFNRTKCSEIVKQAHSLGLMNHLIEEKYGGPGLSHLESTLVIEALSYGCTGLQIAIMGTSLAVAPVLIAANEEQKKKYLGLVASQPVIASYCVTEPGAGSDVNGVKTKVWKTLFYL